MAIWQWSFFRLGYFNNLLLFWLIYSRVGTLGTRNNHIDSTVIIWTFYHLNKYYYVYIFL